LAGSERSSKTGTLDNDDPETLTAGSKREKSAFTKEQIFQQGININLSLSCLSRCLESLVKQASAGSSSSIVIPFRESSLTKLLMNELGKTK
jgi:hypothetical protein